MSSSINVFISFPEPTESFEQFSAKLNDKIEKLKSSLYDNRQFNQQNLFGQRMQKNFQC